jgi:cytochrome c oxidase assembly factor CtaG
MDPVLRAALSSWDWRLEVLIPLTILGILFVRGWWRLRVRTRRTGIPTGRIPADRLGATWRPISYLAGLVVIALALVSPLDVLVQQLFFVHMIQHLLLIMIAPPLLLLPNPMPFLLWGLPDVVRRPVGRALGNVLHKQTVSGGIIRSVTTPGVIYLAFIIVVFGWHDPDLYNAALRSELVHDLEHITFFLAGMLFWWQVIGAGPVIHKQFGQIGRIVFTLAAIPPNMILGIVLAFTPVVIYTFYNDAPRLLNMSALTDQQLSGIIMWIPGSMMYLIAALVLIAGLLKREDKKPIKTRPAWSADEIVAAPGVPPPGSSV